MSSKDIVSQRVNEVLGSYIDNLYSVPEGSYADNPHDKGYFSISPLKQKEYPEHVDAISANNLAGGCDFTGFIDLSADMADEVSNWIYEQGGEELIHLHLTVSQIGAENESGCTLVLFSNPKDPGALYSIETPILKDAGAGGHADPVDAHDFTYRRYDGVDPSLTCDNTKAAANITVMRALDILRFNAPSDRFLPERDYIFRILSITKESSSLLDFSKLISYADTAIDDYRETYSRMRELTLLTGKIEPELTLTIDLDNDPNMVRNIVENPGVAPVKVKCDIDTVNVENSSIHLVLADNTSVAMSYSSLITGLGVSAARNVKLSSALYVFTSKLFDNYSGSDGFLVKCVAQKVITGSNNVKIHYQADNHPELIPKSMLSPEKIDDDTHQEGFKP